MMKNMRILIFESFFLGLGFLEKARRDISSRISFSLIIIDSDMISREFLYLADLTKTQTFCIHELGEVIMVNKVKNLIFVGFQVITPSFESLNNS